MIRMALNKINDSTKDEMLKTLSLIPLVPAVQMSPQILLGMCSKIQLICHTINLIHPCPYQQRKAKLHEHSWGADFIVVLWL